MGSAGHLEVGLADPIDASCGPPEVLEGSALPASLQSLPEPPARLFLYGNLPPGPKVAIVGTRRPTPEAARYAEFLAASLAARGVTIFSGGAKGIDAAAHVGALSAGGQTVVIAPSSFDRPFPSRHRALYADIVARGGGYLSRYERDVPARYHQFLERNELMVALSDALILIEAPWRSGARNAGKWARRLERPYFVVPSPPWNQRGLGCILELQLGARALGSPDEIMRALKERQAARRQAAERQTTEGQATESQATESQATEGQATERRAAEPGSALERARAGSKRGAEPGSARGGAASLRHPPDEGGSLAGRILTAIREDVRYPGELARALGATLPEVQHALLLMTLSGDIEQGAGGQLTITRR